ncbi:hypothetical protein D3C75_881660 [compost metagenome]
MADLPFHRNCLRTQRGNGPCTVKRLLIKRLGHIQHHCCGNRLKLSEQHPLPFVPASIPVGNPAFRAVSRFNMVPIAPMLVTDHLLGSIGLVKSTLVILR